MDIIYGEPATDEDKINSFIMGRLYPMVDDFSLAHGLADDVDVHIIRYFAERLVAIECYTPDQIADLVRETASQFQQELDDAMADDVPTPAPLPPPKRSHLRLV